MRDRLAARHLALGALDIDMNPLMVAGRVGEFVDLFLGDRKPVADPDLLAFKGLQIGGAFDFQHRGLPRYTSLCEWSLLPFPRNDTKKEPAIARSPPTNQSPPGGPQPPLHLS